MTPARLDDLDPRQLTPLADAIRALGRDATSIEAAAQAAARLLYDTLVDSTGAPGCALVRVYKAHPYGKLPPDLRAFARDLVDEEPVEEMRCLTLLGTAGVEPDWNDRRRSVGHRAIPLPSVDFVQRLPMVAQLIAQLGLDPDTVMRPPKNAARLAQQTYDAFYVARAAGSPHIPGQEFVAEHAIASAVGFGGLLLNGDFYAAIAFSRIPLGEGDARTLKILALPLRVALTPMIGRPTFDE